MRYFIRLADTEHCVEVVASPTGWLVRDAQGTRTVSIVGEAGACRVLVDGRVVDLSVTDHAGTSKQDSAGQGRTHTLEVFGLGTSHTLSIVSERDRVRADAATATAASQRTLVAHMPGRVVQMRVQPGQHVSKGDALLVLEAMKMENELYADEDLQVLTVCVRPGDALEMGAPLLVVQC
jgi:biotin carboxyl carrier protein